MENPKRYYRELKRELKKLGNKHRRSFFKRQLQDHPEEAHWDEYHFGDESTKPLNGMFRDATRDKDDNYPDEDQDRY